MNILHLLAPGPLAGAEKSVLVCVEALQNLGCNLSLLAIRDLRNPVSAEQFLEEARKRNIEVQWLESGRRLDAGLFLKMRGVIRRGMFDIIHAHGYKALFYVTFCRPEKSALISTYHGATSHTIPVRFYEIIERRLFRRLDRIFAVSRAARRFLERRGVPSETITVVPNVLSISSEVLKGPVKASGASRLKLLCLGRLSTEKGVDVLLRACSFLAASLPFKLKIVGEGPERNRLEEMIRQKNLGHVVQLEGFQNDIVPYLLEADVLVLPSRTEGLPMSLIEAAACGLPVVGSDVGGIPEIVDNGTTGLLVDPGDPEQLAEALKTMGADREKFREASFRKAAAIRQEFSPEKWARTAIAEYRSILDKRATWTG